VERAYARLSRSGAAIADALNAGFIYLEVRCIGCDTHQTVPLDIVRRPKSAPIHELERYMRCKDCSQARGYPYKRSHLVALRTTKISASDPIDVVAGGTVNCTFTMIDVTLTSRFPHFYDGVGAHPKLRTEGTRPMIGGLNVAAIAFALAACALTIAVAELVGSALH
jgi:hypothetical protein